MIGRWLTQCAAPGQAVDPDARSVATFQHGLGLDQALQAHRHAGRDLRGRSGAELGGKRDTTRDGVRASVGVDALPRESRCLDRTPRFTHRSVHRSRRASYERPSPRGGPSTRWFSSRRHRWEVVGDLRWYPLEGSVEGLLGHGPQFSRARGLRDPSPTDQVFASSRELPLEDR